MVLGTAQAAGGTPWAPISRPRFTPCPALPFQPLTRYPGGVKITYAPVTLYFTSRLPTGDLLQYITINPAVTNPSVWMGDVQTLYVGGDFTPATAYTLTLSAGMPDAWGQTLGQPYTLSFRTANLDPAVQPGDPR